MAHVIPPVRGQRHLGPSFTLLKRGRVRHWVGSWNLGDLESQWHLRYPPNFGAWEFPSLKPSRIQAKHQDSSWFIWRCQKCWWLFIMLINMLVNHVHLDDNQALNWVMPLIMFPTCWCTPFLDVSVISKVPSKRWRSKLSKNRGRIKTIGFILW